MPTNLTGPCCRPRFPDPTKPSGFFRKIPADNQKEVFGDSGQVCKKADCWRYFGYKEEKQKAGRPRKRPVTEAGPSTGVPVAVAEDPCPPIVVKVDEVWGVRYVNIASMTEAERGNKLQLPPHTNLEVLCHGHFRRTEDDDNGFYCAFWVPLFKLHKFFSREEVAASMDYFENGLYTELNEGLDAFEQSDEFAQQQDE
eukprot:CAMPEP_0119314254 /NCGR_PEP_ID=MMETSP1333-20130426/32217_1 /TAXON_ID=418940 /ORGANISM="Scyphosphaera apsteinii, Strain RCC1455" /LENGTH=197 /DNA_ID=CAMNT_0007319331 /DNA_START=26 /DNA_END=619 /DNA_ORIENTATION=+